MWGRQKMQLNLTLTLPYGLDTASFAQLGGRKEIPSAVEPRINASMA